MTKRLLACSVIDCACPFTSFWHEWQLAQLKSTVGLYFDHVVYVLNGSGIEFPGSRIVGSSNSLIPARSLIGLQALSEYCRREADYRNYLYLSQTAVPIKDGWLELLSRRMAKYGKRFAAPVCGGSSIVPAADIIFGSDANCIEFGADSTGISPICESDRSQWYPLLATDRKHTREDAGHIYLDLFYHYRSSLEYPPAGLITDRNAFIRTLQETPVC